MLCCARSQVLELKVDEPMVEPMGHSRLLSILPPLVSAVATHHGIVERRLRERIWTQQRD